MISTFGLPSKASFYPCILGTFNQVKPNHAADELCDIGEVSEFL